MGRRARLATSLNSKAAELQGFRDRIAKSNLALQTILQTITVSLSLRNNASQTLILRGLDDLKDSIDRVISRSWQNSGSATDRLHEGALNLHADAKINRNLRDLAQAAKQFHSAASSTASSAANSARSEDEGSIAPWQSYPGADMSLVGDFSDDLRERVEEYVRDAPTALSSGNSGQRRTLQTVARSPSPVHILATMREEAFEDDSEYDETDEVDEAEFEMAFLRGLQELISHHIRAGNYTKAIDFINEAMSNSAVTTCGNLLRILQSQLTLAYLLQGQWRLASSMLTTSLASAKKDRDAVVCSLLHGLAIAHLTEYAFDDALAACKMALYGRRRLQKRDETSPQSVNETLGLFATIYDMLGDYVRAEVLRGQLPRDFVYSHPKSAMAFLLHEDTFKDLIQGDIGTSEASNMSVVPGIFELADSADNLLPGLKRRATTTCPMSPLRTRICEHERLERDTTKEVVLVEHTSPSDADDEASPITEEPWPEVEPLRRRLTQIFRTTRPRRSASMKPIQDQEEDENDSGYGTSSPVASSGPSSPWRFRDFSPLKRTKTKRLLKKQPIKKNKEKFKVLNMESKAKVEAPKEIISPISSPSHDEAAWDSDRWGFSGQLAELDTAETTTDAEDQSSLGQADQPMQDKLAAPRSVHWPSDASILAENESDVRLAASTTTAETTDTRTRPSKLQIPQPLSPTKKAPLSIPSLDPLNLTGQPLSPRLTDILSSVSHCFTSISALLTSDDMDATRIQLCYLQGQLHAYGYDRTLESDVEAAIARLWRKSAKLRRGSRGGEALEKGQEEEGRDQKSVIVDKVVGPDTPISKKPYEQPEATPGTSPDIGIEHAITRVDGEDTTTREKRPQSSTAARASALKPAKTTPEVLEPQADHASDTGSEEEGRRTVSLCQQAFKSDKLEMTSNTALMGKGTHDRALSPKFSFER
ncbi:hypothetical protein CC79DRAFT_1330895 [Sarocladium strictum]